MHTRTEFHGAFEQRPNQKLTLNVPDRVDVGEFSALQKLAVLVESVSFLQHDAIPAYPVEQPESLQDSQPIRLDEYSGAYFTHNAVALVHVHPPAVRRKCDRCTQAGHTT